MLDSVQSKEIEFDFSMYLEFPQIFTVLVDEISPDFSTCLSFHSIDFMV